MPRLDYSGGATCGSLLLEPQRVNTISQSEYFGGQQISSSATLEINTTTSPQGVQNASTLTSNTSSGAVKFLNFAGVQAGASDDSVFSLFVKKYNHRYIQLINNGDNDLYANFDIQDGVVGNTGSQTTASIEDYGNGWYRCSIVSDGSQNINANQRIYLADSLTQSYASSSNVASGDGVYIYGAMQENNASHPTSYIPTYGTSVTRSHDVCKITGADATDIINQPAMTLFVEAQLDDNGATTILSMLRDLTGGLYNDFISLTYTNSLKVNFEVRENASPQATIQSGVLSEGVHKIAAVLTSTSMKLFIDGSLENSATITAIPDDLDEIYLAGYPDTTARFGTKKQFLFFPTALSDDECIQLTTL